MDRRRFIHSSLLLSLSISGCKSIQTTLLDRHAPSGGTECIDLDGYPITLKIPTHLRLTLYETTFLEEKPKVGTEVNGWEIVTVNGTALTTMTFSTQLIETEKIFTLDHKRPCAGQNKYGVNFTDDQYIDQMSSGLTDDAIRQSGIALSRAVTLLAGRNVQARTPDEATRTLASGAFTSIYTDALSKKTRPVPEAMRIGSTELGDSTLKTQSISNVLATEIFETDDPEFELRVSDFLRKSLDCKH